MRQHLIPALIFSLALAAGVGGRAARAQQAGPAAGLIGQQVTACNYNKDLAVTVTGVDWTSVVADAVAPDGTMWVVALLDVTNLSEISEALTSRPLQLQDAS